jgi:hypothetical protein
MLPLSTIGEQIATKRRVMGLSRLMLATKARISRATLDALENNRLGDWAIRR